MNARLSYFIIAVAMIVVAITFLYGLGYLQERSGYYTHIWGHVSYNGKPVPGCAIYFQSADPQKTHWGIGHLNESGLYFLTAYKLDYPLEPGPYTIFLRPLTQAPTITDLIESSLTIAGSKQSTENPSPSSRPTPESPIPTRFTDAKTSGLHVNIDGRPQRIEIHLTD